jgi:hypothetical protein
MYVLNREVQTGGIRYAIGTPLDKLPEENHQSLIQTRWVSLAPAKPKPKPVLPAEMTPEPVEAEELDEPAEQQDAASEEQTSVEDSDVEQTSDIDDSPSLHTLPISDELKELLAEAMLDDEPLTTVADVIAFGERNKGFRVIKGIGKVGNDEIQAALAGM